MKKLLALGLAAAMTVGSLGIAGQASAHPQPEHQDGEEKEARAP